MASRARAGGLRAMARGPRRQARGPGAAIKRLMPRIRISTRRRTRTSVTAVDAAPEMLALAQNRVADPWVRFLCADLVHVAPGPSLRRGLLRLLAVACPARVRARTD